MPNLIVNKNNQGTVTIPKKLIEALKWQKGDMLLISKVPSQEHIIIENISTKKYKK